MSKKDLIHRMMDYLDITTLVDATKIVGTFPCQHIFTITYLRGKNEAYMEGRGMNLLMLDADSDEVIDAIYDELADRCKKKIQLEMYEAQAMKSLGFIP